MSVEKPREIAVHILRVRFSGHEYVEKLFEDEMAANHLPPADRALCQELTYGVVRWQRPLDWLIASKTQGRTQNLVLQILLRLGLYQIFWLDRIPDHAAVNETVELAKLLGFGPQAGFINAVLRGCLRERAALSTQLQALKRDEMALGYSHPDWLVERWRQRFGPGKTMTLLDWNNRPPPTFARLNTLKTDAATLARRWEQEEVSFTPRSWNWTGEGLCFELLKHRPFAQSRSFGEGFYYIQDPSTLLAVKLLDPKPGEVVLDSCAAPGGKTTLIAQLMQNRGRIVAEDSSPSRLGLIRENCQRLGVSIATATTTGVTDTQLFDRILVDAPCSNTGVLRRRVDLRWRIRLEEINRLCAAQSDLLQHAAKRLKVGGRLVYSTCSLEPEENTLQIKSFVERNPAFRLEQERQLLPFEEDTDGAFVAVLTRSV